MALTLMPNLDFVRSTSMNRFQFPIAVAATSLAQVAILLGVGGLVVGNALANSPFMAAANVAGGPWSGRWGGDHGEWQLPPQLAGLADVPAGERFSHFRGVQVQLVDKDNTPLNVEVVPGVATAVTSSTLMMTSNDGATRTFALDANTAIRSHDRARTTVNQNDQVVVLTLNNAATATGVIVLGK